MEFNEVIGRRRTSREWTDREVDFETVKRRISKLPLAIFAQQQGQFRGEILNLTPKNAPVIQETEVKSIITKSNLPVCEYSVNPYVGCTHACKYCYASFMKRFTGHTEEWGTFLDVKQKLLDNT